MPETRSVRVMTAASTAKCYGFPAPSLVHAILEAMQSPRRQSTLATAAVLALAMALSISVAMVAGGNSGQACSMGCRVALVADRTLECAHVHADDGLRARGPSHAHPVATSDPAEAHSAPAAWRTLDMPPPAR
jgi:hypothetical protein